MIYWDPRVPMTDGRNGLVPVSQEHMNVCVCPLTQRVYCECFREMVCIHVGNRAYAHKWSDKLYQPCPSFTLHALPSLTVATRVLVEIMFKAPYNLNILNSNL